MEDLAEVKLCGSAFQVNYKTCMRTFAGLGAGGLLIREVPMMDGSPKLNIS